MDRTDKAGLYLHIPFCAGKCPYCDFYSVGKKDLIASYVSALIDEIKTKRRTDEFIKDSNIPIDTVYFGGGTPSLLSGENIADIMNAVRENYVLSEDAEITAEANPSSAGFDDFIKGAVKAGVNRISLGMQSAVTAERQKLGRKGTGDSVKTAVNKVRKAGIDNISLDIMLGIPDSTMDSLEYTLDFALSLGVPHISAYMLKLEEGTYFYKNQHKLNLPDEDTVCDMYLFMCSYLENKGFSHYEISNFSKEGFSSRHNMKYWRLTPYIGLGPGAHSFYDNRRFYFPRDINSFINGERAVFDCTGGDSEEKLMLSLRTDRGINLNDYSRAFYEKAMTFVNNGFAVIKNNIFSLTDRGFLISNSVISTLLLEI